MIWLFGMMPDALDDGEGHREHWLWMFCEFFW